MDRIVIKDLEVFANHGVFPEEKALGQKFLLSAEISFDMSPLAQSSDLTKSVHYGEVCHLMTQVFQGVSHDLIETAGLALVDAIFANYPICRQIEVEIKKPWAPIGLPLQGVSVVLSRKKRNYYLSLGTNLGDKAGNLAFARKELQAKGIEIEKASQEYVTSAWGLEDQPDFLNQCLQVTSYQEPGTVLRLIQAVEAAAGRVRREKWGPRTLDIDILLVDQEIIHQEDLIVPHPYLSQRAFVLEPLVEIAPHLVHPFLNKTMTQLYKDLNQ